MIYTAYFENISSGAVADTPKTLIALRAADTLGYRFRILSVYVGPADDTAADLNVELQLKRVDDVSTGSAGTPNATPTPVPQDSLTMASVITCGTDYVTGGAEPATYTNPVWGIAMNRRNSFPDVLHENDPRVPVANRDQLIGLLATPRTGAAAVLSGYITYKEF